VIDSDAAVVRFVRSALGRVPFRVACLEHDLREPLPPALVHRFDTVLADPPYTAAGARLFLSRAVDALDGGGDVFLSFGSRRPGVALLLQRTIGEVGFVIRGLARDFNEYVGAGVLGGTSHLYHLSAADELHPAVSGAYDGPLYTAETPAA
jgi:predicted methyltransferase